MNVNDDSKDPAVPPTGDVAQHRRPGLPNPANIVSERELQSKKGAHYRVIKTRERDAYDKAEEP